MARFSTGARQVPLKGRSAWLLTAVTAAAILTSVTPAKAQDPWGLGDITVFGWAVHNLRVGVALSPDYMGSDDYDLKLSGGLSAALHGKEPPFGAPDDGVSLGLFGGEDWSLGVAGRFRSSRDDDNDLQGFEKIDWTVEAGAFANYWPNDQLRLRGEIRHGFGGHSAWVANLGADAIWRERALVLSVGPRLSWGESKFARTYFSVDPDEAARSPFDIAPFTPDDAVWAAGVLASLEYRVSRHWGVTATAGYKRMLGDATDSPIVADLGSADQFSTSLGVRYILGK